MNESYIIGPPCVFIACPLVSSEAHISSNLLIVEGLIATWSYFLIPIQKVVNLLGQLLWLLLTKR